MKSNKEMQTKSFKRKERENEGKWRRKWVTRRSQKRSMMKINIHFKPVFQHFNAVQFREMRDSRIK